MKKKNEPFDIDAERLKNAERIVNFAKWFKTYCYYKKHPWVRYFVGPMKYWWVMNAWKDMPVNIKYSVLLDELLVKDQKRIDKRKNK
jgi:hypothetical protein